MEYHANPAQHMVLCADCGTPIEPNNANLCANCLRNTVDITEWIPKQATVNFCRNCERYLNPPNTWVIAQPESRELLAICLKKLKSLKNVRLIDANFIWTEPHSKRLRVKLEGGGLLGEDPVWSFNWHYEAFGIPRGATRVLAGAQGLNKGFVMGPHLAFQCHFEVTQETVEAWCAEGAKEVAQRDERSVQSIEEMLSQAPQVLPALHQTARRVYARWIDGVKQRDGAK